MSFILTSKTKARARQRPAGILRLDLSHKSAPDFAYHTSNGIVIQEKKTGGMTFATNSGSVSPRGAGLFFDGDGDYATAPTAVAGASSSSMLMLASLDAYNNGGQSGVEGMFVVGLWGSDTKGDIKFVNRSTDGTLNFELGTNTVGRITVAHSKINLFQPYSWLATRHNSDGQVLYRDGISMGTNIPQTHTGVTARSPTIGTYPGNASLTETIMTFYLGCIWDSRTLSSHESREISEYPWQLFRSTARRLYFDVAAAAAAPTLWAQAAL